MNVKYMGYIQSNHHYYINKFYDFENAIRTTKIKSAAESAIILTRPARKFAAHFHKVLLRLGILLAASAT